jgi:PhnB protein
MSDAPVTRRPWAIGILETDSEGEFAMTMTEACQKTQPEVLGGVVPYLSLSSASKAAEFYTRAFAARIAGGQPPDSSGRTMHIHLYINGGSLMLSDAYPEYGHPLQTQQGYALHMKVDDVDKWWQRAVDAGAEIVLPLQKMFWGDRYGQLRDPFGVTWSMGAPSE